MAVTVHADGTTGQTSGGADTSAGTAIVAGTYVFEIDTNLMADGDVVYLRIHKIVRASGTKRVAYFTAFYGAQPTHDKIKVSLPISNALTDTASLDFTVEQPFGTTRALPFSILRHA